MGGAKKPTTANKDKSAGGNKDSKKGKKDKGESGPKKAEITVMVNEQQAMKIIQNSKVLQFKILQDKQELKFQQQMHF